jgi:hypothetical protein
MNLGVLPSGAVYDQELFGEKVTEEHRSARKIFCLCSEDRQTPVVWKRAWSHSVVSNHYPVSHKFGYLEHTRAAKTRCRMFFPS